MFTVDQIEQAHSKVKSGADFPKYIAEIRQMGVTAFEIWVKDGHTIYFGEDGFQAKSLPQYDALVINDECDRKRFIHYLKIHQQGQTDFYTFCYHCAETGIEKWFVSLDDMLCFYFDKASIEVLEERIPH
ncbi:DUF1398 domain-containing protein [Paludibacter jiangxiensis]|uniref:Phage envelope protein n=1 Tax=Paludibacter jiangxiensis TaxID=681398 RepID=A0A161LSK7_9BACT|nr:DUF1398 family protein [Paludibacter jiangxiensis]GAT63760.1 hypothetical protein PJIAN_4301 [Paludibacter jiangxiensis]